jgi:hypothetical protein
VVTVGAMSAEELKPWGFHALMLPGMSPEVKRQMDVSYNQRVIV